MPYEYTNIFAVKTTGIDILTKIGKNIDFIFFLVLNGRMFISEYFDTLFLLLRQIYPEILKLLLIHLA